MGLNVMAVRPVGKAVAAAFPADVVCLVLRPARAEHGGGRSGDA
jgi:hypothetical protein